MEHFFDTGYFPADTDARVEAVAKVSGKGKYAAEYQADGICYGFFATSTIAAGNIVSIDVAVAKQADGVIDIITHLNKPLVPGLSDETKIRESRFGLPVFHTDKIYFKGQPIALIIAETLEEATYAASLITAVYNTTPHNVDFEQSHPKVPTKPDGKERGALQAWQNAPRMVEAEYTIGNEVHNPMEMHATIAHWISDNKLKLYDKTQGVNNVQRTIARLFGVPNENVEVMSEFVGGGFGSGLRVWSNTLAAVMGARQVKRPVKLMLSRPQMFMLTGYRPQSWQKVKLGADENGKLLGLHHQGRNSTSMYENFAEGFTRECRLIYNVENLKTESATVPLNLSTPTWMRGPGDCSGDFAIESTVDELSYVLKLDPVEFRLKNISNEKDPETGKPWSTNYVSECIRKGAEKIGWRDRPTQPGQLTEGDWKIGYGMAVGMWGAGRQNASAGIKMQKDGSILVQTAMTDIGTGTGTGIQNVAHDNTGIPKTKIKIELGNSSLPPAPSQGGSTGLSSISGAVTAVCNALKQKLVDYAAIVDNNYKGISIAELVISETGISMKSGNSTSITFDTLFDTNHINTIAVEASAGPGDERQKFSFCSSAAHFCKLRVHTKTGKVKIERMVCTVDAGKVINSKAAANQISGAAVGGIGMALMEEQNVDNVLGSLLSNDLAGYHFAVNADAPIIEVAFIDKPDFNSNPSGSKGIGEVGIIGCAAAIANAIYNATGKRLRNLPITPDKVLMG